MSKPFTDFTFDDAANAVQVSDMCPNLATFNLRDDRIVDPVPSGQFSLIAMLSRLERFLNFTYLLIGQFRDSVILTAWRQADFKGVFRVTREGYIFQIADSVISLDTVNVINIVARWLRPNEGSYNQRLDRISSRLAGQTKHSVVIAVCTFYWFYYPTGLCAAGSKVAPDSTEARDGIDSGEPSNNGTPFFGFEFFSAKFVDRHGMNLLLRFVSSLGWGGVKSSLQPLWIIS